MHKSIDKNKALVFDADVIIHFISGDRLLDLFKIFPNKCLILDKVYMEITKRVQTKITIDNQIKLGFIDIVKFPSNLIIIKEYAHLRSALMNKGEGESACLAYCKHTKDVIASSNLKDIGVYCNLHSIDYLTTMDFIGHAFFNQLWTIQDCDEFIGRVLANNHKLPFSSFAEYAKSEGLNLTG